MYTWLDAAERLLLPASNKTMWRRGIREADIRTYIINEVEDKHWRVRYEMKNEIMLHFTKQSLLSFFLSRSTEDSVVDWLLISFVFYYPHFVFMIASFTFHSFIAMAHSATPAAHRRGQAKLCSHLHTTNRKVKNRKKNIEIDDWERGEKPKYSFVWTISIIIKPNHQMLKEIVLELYDTRPTSIASIVRWCAVPKHIYHIQWVHIDGGQPASFTYHSNAPCTWMWFDGEPGHRSHARTPSNGQNEWE